MSLRFVNPITGRVLEIGYASPPILQDQRGMSSLSPSRFSESLVDSSPAASSSIPSGSSSVPVESSSVVALSDFSRIADLYWRCVDRPGAGTTAYWITIRAEVKIYDTGEVILAGTIRYTGAASVDVRVWVGTSESVGAYHTIGSVSSAEGAKAFSWFHTMGAGEELYFIYGDNSGTPGGQYPIFHYLLLPRGGTEILPVHVIPTWDQGGGTGGHVDLTIAFSGGDVLLTGHYIGSGATGILYSLDGNETNQVTHFNQVGSINPFSYSRAVPASGLLIVGYTSKSGTNVFRNGVGFGIVPTDGVCVERGAD